LINLEHYGNAPYSVLINAQSLNILTFVNQN